MLRLPRASFRQLLVVAFLLVALLLAAVPLRGLFTLENLMNKSRAGAEREVELNTSLQLLTERSVGMERAARQYLVLGDPVLRQRFEAAAKDANDALARLRVADLAADEGRNWQEQLAMIRSLLSPARRGASGSEQKLIATFAELNRVNESIAVLARKAAQDDSRALLEALDVSRLELGRQLGVSLIIAVFLAFAFGLWLSRPLKNVEAAIIDLGENRLDNPIDIRGPTDVRLLGRRLDWLRLRLAELDSDKARFLRKVSHELKTPLAALREGVALLEDGVAGALTEKQGGIARILRQNTALLQGQIEDLLRFNAAAFEARRLVRNRCELGALLNEVVAQQHLQAQARQLQVNVDGAPVWAEVDAEKLGTAIANILSNAIRFSPRGGTIDIALSEGDGGVRIAIADSGPGVAEADRAHIFEPFFRGDNQPPDAIRGSGIGLSIVQEYIVAHGGRVSLSTEQPGTHFIIELPHADQK